LHKTKNCKILFQKCPFLNHTQFGPPKIYFGGVNPWYLFAFYWNLINLSFLPVKHNLN